MTFILATNFEREEIRMRVKLCWRFWGFPFYDRLASEARRVNVSRLFRRSHPRLSGHQRKCNVCKSSDRASIQECQNPTLSNRGIIRRDKYRGLELELARNALCIWGAPTFWQNRDHRLIPRSRYWLLFLKTFAKTSSDLPCRCSVRYSTLQEHCGKK